MYETRQSPAENEGVNFVIDERDERGRHIFDDTLLIAINGYHRGVSFILPKTEYDKPWTLVFNKRDATPPPGKPVESELHDIYHLRRT